ncbi:KdpD-like non-kinase potassium sensor [Rossellomorea marisflavi]|uniref:KdpD-like non-kinase potassium sensor n=1 Tax=Rossellomorea marisflavi TaxID=189381 RepID=UPI00203ABD93|nr:KdpD-like non-kinase potassium sensor [Rossellomorea marisflavi]MCM2590092.1 KdpD-like non-kinase potassium sensor [Rossellomorea marisflavi]
MNPYFRKKRPEEILEEIHRSTLGRLKLYVGAAPGVGKTFKMLQDAAQWRQDGRDVVIGLIETHGRKETADVIGGLEQVPLKQVQYKGKVFHELDVARIKERKPEIVLIDELAHSNVPGARRVKRYQDVEEILQAGIDVWSAMNIQHLESVNDIVQRITGITVRERVPDTFIQQAAEIQLIDITPETLRKRMREGRIYPPQKIEQSLSHFFTSSNLSALRELSLRELADDVDGRMKGGRAPTGVHERILVCVHYGPTAEKLIRRGWRMADRLKAELVILTVVEASTLSPQQKKKIEEWHTLAKQFGAIMIVEDGGKRHAATVIVDVAFRHNITQILLGQSARSRWEEIRKGSIINRIMRESSNMDIHIVADGR